MRLHFGTGLSFDFVKAEIYSATSNLLDRVGLLKNVPLLPTVHHNFFCDVFKSSRLGSYLTSRIVVLANPNLLVSHLSIF